MFSTAILSAVVLLGPSQTGAVAPAGVQEKPIQGVKVGQAIPGPFFPYNLTGNRETSYACPVTAFEDNPTVLVFVSMGEEGSDTVKKLLTELDAALVRYKRDNLRAFVTIVEPKIEGAIFQKDDERNAAAEKLKGLIASLMLKSLNFGLDSAQGLKDWGIAPEKAITIVLYQNYKVVQTQTVAATELSEETVAAWMGQLVSKKMVQPRRVNPLPLPRP